MTIERPKSFKVGDREYFDAGGLKSYDSDYFRGTSQTIRRIITKKTINQTNYVYATHSKRKGWSVSTNQEKPSSKAKLLLLNTWVFENIPKMKPDSVESVEESSYCAEVPPVFRLDDSEKFKDDEGNPIEIETRGERKSDQVYFRAKHVAEAFEMPNLIRVVKDKESYKTNTDYNTFTLPIYTNGVKTSEKRQTYLTYEGMLKVLYTSRSGNAKAFRSWATDILFTHQMGSKEQKEEMSSNVLGIQVKSLREVLKKSARSVPCIYQFALGTVKSLRKSMKLSDDLPDDDIVIKYGLTDDLVRRSSEHTKTYGKIAGVNLEMMNFTYIDPKFLYAAEVDLKEFFGDIETPIEYESFKELVAINPKHSKQIKKQFRYISTEFAGSVSELTMQVEKLKQEMEMMKERHQWALKEKDHIIETKNQIIETKNMEISKQAVEIEIRDLRLQMK
jgi:hypothetical protein